MLFFKGNSSTSDSNEFSVICSFSSGNATLFLLTFGRMRFKRSDIVFGVFSYTKSVVVVVSGVVVVAVVVDVVVVVLVVVIAGLRVEVE